MPNIMWGVFSQKGTLKAVAPSKWRARLFGESWNSKFHIRPIAIERSGEGTIKYLQIITRDKDRIYTKRTV